MRDIDYGNALLCETLLDRMHNKRRQVCCCTVCGCSICSGDDYYNIGGDPVCEDCIDAYKEVAEA